MGNKYADRSAGRRMKIKSNHVAEHQFSKQTVFTMNGQVSLGIFVDYTPREVDELSIGQLLKFALAC